MQCIQSVTKCFWSTCTTTATTRDEPCCARTQASWILNLLDFGVTTSVVDFDDLMCRVSSANLSTKAWRIRVREAPETCVVSSHAVHLCGADFPAMVLARWFKFRLDWSDLRGVIKGRKCSTEQEPTSPHRVSDWEDCRLLARLIHNAEISCAGRCALMSKTFERISQAPCATEWLQPNCFHRFFPVVTFRSCARVCVHIAQKTLNAHRFTSVRSACRLIAIREA